MKSNETYWVFEEDLASALVGPFDSKEAAEVHPRSGSATRHIVPSLVAKHMLESVDLVFTPAEDLEEVV